MKITKINWKTRIFRFKYFLFVIVSICFVNCKNNKVILSANPKFFSKFSEVDSISFEALFEYTSGTPLKLFQYDSSLIIFNNGRNIDYFLFNYNLKNKKLSKGYLRKGRGPGEAIGGFDCGIVRNNLWVHDVTLKKIIFFELSKTVPGNDRLFPYTEYSLNKFYYQISFLDTNSFYAVGYPNSSSIIEQVDLKSNKHLQEIGEFKHIPKDIPVDACKDAYLSFIFNKPSGDKFVLPFVQTDIIQIYNLGSDNTLTMQGPEQFDVDFKSQKRRRGDGYFADITKKTRDSFVGGTVTDSLIYLVYSGNLAIENIHKGRAIFVFDWNGNPLKKIVLDRLVNVIAVSADNKHLYSFDEETGYLMKADI